MDDAPDRLAPARQAAPAKVNPLAELARRGCGIVLRHRLVGVIGILASLATAFCLATTRATQTWEARGTLLFTPLTDPEQGGGLYVSPDLKTVSALAKSPGILDAIREEFDLDIPTKVLEKLFNVGTPSGTRMIDVKLGWADPEDATAMVARLMDLFHAEVKALRVRKIDGYITDLEVHVETSKARIREATTALDDFRTRENIGIFGEDLIRLNAEAMSLEDDLSEAERAAATIQAQSVELHRQVEILKRRNSEGSGEGSGEAEDESLADNRRRQERLRELIAEERTALEFRAKLDAKRLEYQRTIALHKRGYASQETLNQLSAEIQTLESRALDSENIQSWKSELDRLDQAVVPKGSGKTRGSTVIEQTNLKELELELLRAGNEEKSDRLREALNATRKAIRRLRVLAQEHEALASQVKAHEAEAQAAIAELASLRKIRAISTPEFSVVTPARSGPDPVSSNKKLILLGVFMAGTAATLGALALVDLLIWPTADALGAARKLNLPILVRLSSPALEGDPANIPGQSEDPMLRLLALRLRQAVASPGCMFLFSTLNASLGSARLIAALASCLARRDERVLILDAAGHPEDQPVWRAIRARWLPHCSASDLDRGLFSYLGFGCDDPDEIIFPTHSPGVDCLPAGSLEGSVESIATHRMGELLEILRARYSIILAVGPRADQQVDLEVLAAQSEGIVFHAADKAALCPVDSSAIALLAQLDAPILGAVVAMPRRAPGRHGARSGRFRDLQSP